MNSRIAHPITIGHRFVIALVILSGSLLPLNKAYANLTLNPSFGNNGVVSTAINAADQRQIAIQPDGKVLVSGYKTTSGTIAAAVARYNTDGTLDQTFGTGGVFTLSADSETSADAGVVVQSDGKIIFTGEAEVFSSTGTFGHKLLIGRLNSNGTLDTNYGTNGITVTDLPDSDVNASAVAIQGDGKVVVAGDAGNGSNNSFWFVARYLSNGTLDTNFGTGGVVVTTGPAYAHPSALAFQSDAKIVVVGSFSSGSEPTVVRYNTDGSLDTGFGDNGKVIESLVRSPNDVAIQNDGKIVVAFGDSLSAVRYNTDGSRDTTFGNNGVASYMQQALAAAYALSIQSDGKIVLGGYIYQNRDFALTTLNPNGTVDTSFGTNGLVTTDVGTNDDEIYQLVPSNGGLVAGGIAGGLGQPYVIAQYVTNAAPAISAFPGGTINEGSTYTATGSFTDPDSTSWTATVDYSDGSGAQPLTLSGTNFSLSHVYKDNGTYTVTVAVTDNQGATGTRTATVTVNNVAPTVGTVMVNPSPAHINAAVTASASFTDPGVLDTHTAIWNWGDGSTTTGTVTETNGSGSVSNTHTYTSFGTYTVTLTVTDKDNASGTNSTSETVVKQITALDPATVWVSKNLLNIGMKLDIKAEVYKDTTLVRSGEIDSVTVGTGGNPTSHTIPFNSFSPVDFPSGSQLKVQVSARNACSGSLLGFGTANLYYNSSAHDSRFGATIGTNATYHLLDGFVLGTSTGTTEKSVSVAAGAKCSPFKSFGTWTITP